MKANAGREASWEPLSITFSFEKGSQLRILVSSKEKNIGYINFSRAKILGGRRIPVQQLQGNDNNNQNVVYTIVGELLPSEDLLAMVRNSGNNNVSAGKLTIVYELPGL